AVLLGLATDAGQCFGVRCVRWGVRELGFCSVHDRFMICAAGLLLNIEPVTKCACAASRYRAPCRWARNPLRHWSRAALLRPWECCFDIRGGVLFARSVVRGW